MKYVGFWHKPLTSAPYVCIEPWTSVPAYDGVIDDLETKRDMMRLAPGQCYKSDFTVTVKQISDNKIIGCTLFGRAVRLSERGPDFSQTGITYKKPKLNTDTVMLCHEF